MIFGGIRNGGPARTTKVDLVDISRQPSTCFSVPDIPVETAGAAAAVVAGKLRYCGGGASFGMLNRCFAYDGGENRWEEMDRMPKPRQGAASSAVDAGNTWLITGGRGVGGSRMTTLNTSLVWTAEDGFSAGPALPADFQNHCQFTVNSTHVLVGPGGVFGPSARVNGRGEPVFMWENQARYFLLDWRTKGWTELPRDEGLLEETIERHNAGQTCGLARSERRGPELVLITETGTVVFNLDQRRWRRGPESPFNSRLPEVVQLDSRRTFATVGGRRHGGEGAETMYEFDAEKGRFLVRMRDPAFARSAHSALVVPPYQGGGGGRSNFGCPMRSSNPGKRHV